MKYNGSLPLNVRQNVRGQAPVFNSRLLYVSVVISSRNPALSANGARGE